MEKKKNTKENQNNGCPCDYCVHYDWDEEGEAYECNMALDEDEMVYFLHGHFKNCPYYQPYDEYKIARKQ